MDSSEGTRDALRIKDLKKKCAHANEERVIRAVKISFRKLEKCKTCRVFQIDGDGEMMENARTKTESKERRRGFLVSIVLFASNREKLASP